MTGGSGSVVYRAMGQLRFSLLALLIGVVAGIGAVLFRGLIALIHNGLFLGTFSAVYDANVHTPSSPWGVLVIFVPVVGAVSVAFLVKTFAPEAKGHGVPEVMDAIYYQGGKIRPIVALIKSLASALSIGSGGSVGREGPIIQIGSSFGASLGQFLRMPPWQRIVLIGCGAGGGIAATFNTPVGGVLFVIEIMLFEFSARTLIPVVIATVTATYVGQIFLGANPSFVIPAMEMPYFHLTKPSVLLAYVGLGITMGLAATLFIRSIYAFEDFFEKRVKGSYYRQHILGMFAVGVMLYGFMAIFGHYYIEGVGYATVQDLLSNDQLPLYLVLVLFGAKLLATSLTLGSGASGGIFSPGLFLGATIGTAYGMILRALFPAIEISPPAFAVAGMAGMVGGSTGAAVAAIVMIFEMTLDYNVIIPITVVVAISYGVRVWFCKDSIYTMKLTRRGHYLSGALRASPHLVKRAREVMEEHIGTITCAASGDDMAAALSAHPAISFYLVIEQDRVIGFVKSGTMFQAILQGKATASQLAVRQYATVQEDTTVEEVLAAMRAAGANVALVTDGSGTPAAGDVKGVITEQQLVQAMLNAAEFYLD
jgi:CIC family chloride channel protein